jgi:hypothetical protein
VEEVVVLFDHRYVELDEGDACNVDPEQTAPLEGLMLKAGFTVNATGVDTEELALFVQVTLHL